MTPTVLPALSVLCLSLSAASPPTAATVDRVIVAVEDPLGSTQPSSGKFGPSDARAARIDARRADLAARKERVTKRLSRALGRPVELVHRYPAFSLFAIDVDATARDLLAKDPEVTAVFDDEIHLPSLESSLPHIHAPTFHEAQGGGEGVAVAILDSPVRYEGGHFGTCSAPGSRGCALVAQLNFSSGQSVQQVRDYEDRYGLESHGTNVAAIAHGVAPDASVIGLNVFTGSGGRIRAATSDLVAALDWVAFNASSQKIVAANMSLGSERSEWEACNDDAYAEPIRTLFYDHDVLTVVASGNDATQNAVNSPACVSLAVTVAAHFDTEVARYNGYDCYQEAPRDQEMACFSNLSGQVDFVAPGVFVDAGGYRLSGTSMATPHVTGAVALVQGHFQSVDGRRRTAEAAHRRLMLSSGRMVHIDGRIFGRLDVASAGGWDWAGAMARFSEEVEAGRIPGPASSSGRFEVTVEDAGFELSGAYLFLEIVHPEPDALQVTLQSPSGRSVQAQLPGGQAHFTGIIGRQFDQDSLRSLAGDVADGTWTLTVHDSNGDGRGHVIAASLLLERSTCQPDCTDAGCGDDGCGRACDGYCEINQRCYAAGTIPHDNPCLQCDPDASTSSWGRSGGGCQISGTCYPPGAPFDTIPCMSCRPEVSTSGWSPNEGVCVVAGTCLEAGERRPGSPCRGCDPRSDPGGWSALDGVACDDDDLCSTEDSCSAGQCEGRPVTCPAPTECQVSAACSAVDGLCVTAPKPDGTPCGNGTCQSGECAVVASESSDGCRCLSSAVPTGGGWLGLGLFALLVVRRRG